MVVKKGKTRRMFTLSDEVLQALAKRALEEKIKGKLRSLHGAESKIVEEALRHYLGVKEDSDAGNGS